MYLEYVSYSSFQSAVAELHWMYAYMVLCVYTAALVLLFWQSLIIYICILEMTTYYQFS